MLKIEIYDNTPANMLRAIRAACNELLGEAHTDLTTQAAEHVTRANELQAAADAEAHKAAAALSAHNLAAPTVAEMIQAGHLPTPTVTLVDEAHLEIPAPTAEELDSAGQPWNAELHASTKSKNADGTWKKKRGALAKAIDEHGGAENVKLNTENAAEVFTAGFTAPPVPPAPAVPAEPIMPKIFALITSQIVTINQAVEAAQAEGFADLGTNGLGGAPREAQEAVLRKLEG